MLSLSGFVPGFASGFVPGFVPGFISCHFSGFVLFPFLLFNIVFFLLPLYYAFIRLSIRLSIKIHPAILFRYCPHPYKIQSHNFAAALKKSGTGRPVNQDTARSASSGTTAGILFQSSPIPANCSVLLCQIPVRSAFQNFQRILRPHFQFIIRRVNTLRVNTVIRQRPYFI